MKTTLRTNQGNRRNRREGERGFALLVVFLVAAGILIALYMEIPRVAFESQRNLEHGNPATGTVTLSGPAAPAGTVVSLSVAPTYATTPASVTVPSGQTSASFTVTTTGVDAQKGATVQATLRGVTESASLTINPATFAALSVNPSSVQGGSSSTGTVAISGPAGPSGALITLTSTVGGVTIPPTVSVAPGQSSATFPISTTPVQTETTVTITGTFEGVSQFATLTINPPALANLTLDPTSLVGGASSTGLVTISSPAPINGLIVTLSSSNKVATVPSLVTVLAGQTSAVFTVATAPVSTQAKSTIIGTMAGSTNTAVLTINPATLASLSLSSPSILGGGSVTGTVSLNAPAGPAGALINLSSNSPAATVISQITIPSGQTSATFSVVTSTVKTAVAATVTATFGKVTLTFGLSVVPLSVASVSMSPSSVSGGASSTGAVTLNGPTPSAGAVVELTSNSKAAVVPKSIKLGAGQTKATFDTTTTAVGATTDVTITATLGTTSAESSLTIDPPTLKVLTLAPTAIIGGAASTATVTLSSAAPTGGLSVKLSSNLPAATIPATVTVEAGKTSASFTVKTVPVDSQQIATISGMLNGISQSSPLTVNAPTLVSLKLSPATVVGGGASTGTVTLNGPAPAGGLQVSLSGGSSLVSVPASVTVEAGKTSGTFSLKTLKTLTKQTATISADLGATTIKTSLTIT